MKYNPLGRTGILVSEVCFGCMTFGGRGFWTSIGTQPQELVNALLKQAFEAGVNFIDTANVYSEGLSEEMTGKALKDLGVGRTRVFVATKVRGRMGPGPNETGLSRGHILDSVDASLRRLGLDHIDLLYIHGLDPLADFEEIMRGLDLVVRAGKVRYIGACNIPAWQIMKANAIAASHRWPRFDALQYFYSIGCRDLEHDIIPMAISEGLAVMPWSPLAGGLFSGKYDRNTATAGDSRRDNFNFPILDRDKAHDIIDVMMPIAKAHGVSGAQVALAWLAQKQGVSSTIIGAKRQEQLTDNLGSYDLKLTSPEIEALDKVSAPNIPYPHWMVSVQNQDRFPAGVITNDSVNP
jgi:aryl-alcohol dehydrogenase-like predicted oxidoreductase